MSGNKIGGLKARDKVLAKDPFFYAKIGAKGGKNGNTGGFSSDKVGADGLTGPERAKLAGAKGGAKSRRRKPKVVVEPNYIDEAADRLSKI